MNPANLTAAERDTILAALRLWQMKNHITPGSVEADYINRLPTRSGPALDSEGIDRLCERLSAPVAAGHESVISEASKVISDQINRHVAMADSHRAWLANDISTRVGELIRKYCEPSWRALYDGLGADYAKLATEHHELQRQYAAEPTQAPEPVNAELLAARKEIARLKQEVLSGHQHFVSIATHLEGPHGVSITEPGSYETLLKIFPSVGGGFVRMLKKHEPTPKGEEPIYPCKEWREFHADKPKHVMHYSYEALNAARAESALAAQKGGQ